MILQHENIILQHKELNQGNATCCLPYLTDTGADVPVLLSLLPGP